MYWWWGWALWQLGEYQAAWEPTERALELARTGEFIEIEANCLRSLGVISYRLIRTNQGNAYTKQALEKYREIKDHRGEIAALNNLGNYQNDLSERNAYYEQALTLTQSTGDRYKEGLITGKQGISSRDSGDFAEAIDLSCLAVEIFREVKNQAFEFGALFHLWLSFFCLGEYDRAEGYLKRAVQIAKEIGVIDYRLLYSQTIQYWIMGNVEQSDAVVEEMTQALDKLEGFVKVNLLQELSVQFHWRGVNQAALEYSQAALQLRQQLSGDVEYDAEFASIWMLQGHAWEGAGNYRKAERAYQVALSKLTYPDWDENPFWISYRVLRIMAGMARVALGCGKPQVAMDHVEEILALDCRDLPGAAASREKGIPINSLINVNIEWILIYQTCYRVLQANQDPRAGEILRRAYDQVQIRANKISDEAIRRSFLENNLWHREVVKTYESLG
jgi:tetratricopeptide (TPR) repeat protein